MIKNCFNDKCIEMKIDLLTPSKPLPENVKTSSKYKQIVLSIKEVGLVEPVIVFILNEGKTIRILDGHLRVEALKELEINNAPCLISTDEESYTYNKQVSRLSVIQEQKMLIKAIESGVSIDKLCLALAIKPDTLKGRFKLLDGICDEVINLLADKHVPRTLFYVIKKMKPYRQIEVVNTMINMNNFSRNFALSMLHMTSSELLTHPKESKSEQKDLIKSIERLEKEMAAVQVETKKLEDNYATDTLKLVIIKSHINKLLANYHILNWLIENNPDYLYQLKKIAGIERLPDK